jgi:membrane protein implicated in regulation of membrane protease activity
MPGEVLEDNAAAREDGVLVWMVAPGQRVDVLAVGARPRALLLPLAAGLLALVAVALIAVVLVRRRRRRHEPRVQGRTGA